MNCSFYGVTLQGELERVEEEQTFQELQSLRQIVYDWFQKEDQIAEVTWTDEMSNQQNVRRLSP